MKRTVGSAAILAAAMALTPLGTAAQQGRMGLGRGMRMRAGMTAPARADSLRGPGVEGVLRLKTQLALTDDQVKRLDQIREDVVKQRTAHLAQMMELRSKVSAGEMTRADLRKQMEAQRDATAQSRTQQLQRVRAVLNDGQRQKIEQMQARARAFMMGRRSAMRGGRYGRMGGGRAVMGGGRGMMGGRGFAPGMRARMRRGGGFGPGMGRGFGAGPGPGMGRGMGPGAGQGPAAGRMIRPQFPGRGPAGPPPPDTVPSVGG